MSKFKVGDMVTSEKYGIGKIIGIGYGEQSHLVEHDEKNDYLHNGHNYSVKEGKGNGKYGHCYWYDKEDLKPVKPKQFTKSDLKERWIVKTRDGHEAMFDGYDFKVIVNGKFQYGLSSIKDYNDDLTCKANILNAKDYDIVEVYKPHYSKVWEREEELAPKKMTVSEICKELGYDIEIVKEEE